MNEEQDVYLRRIYTKLSEYLLIENKLGMNSILLTFLKLKSNVRYRALENSAIESDRINDLYLADLIREKLIRESDTIGKYIITAKGIWHVEKVDNNLTIDTIVDFLDDKYFDISLSGKKLSDKEKVILYAMFCSRTYSIESPIDLKKDKRILDTWERIIDSCYNHLYTLKIIKKMDKSDLYGKKGNEHRISHLIRHTDSIPRKTKGIFNAAGKQKYFLALFKEKKFKSDLLEYLINLIFKDKKLNLEDAEEIIKFSNKIAYDEAPHIFENIFEHVFASYEYDEIINDIIKKLFY